MLPVRNAGNEFLWIDSTIYTEIMDIILRSALDHMAESSFGTP